MKCTDFLSEYGYYKSKPKFISEKYTEKNGKISLANGQVKFHDEDERTASIYSTADSI